MIIIYFFIAHWVLSLFFQTFFLHRYAAHAMFKMSPFWEKVFYVCTFIAQGSSFLSPYAYGVMHRLHHIHADTEEDPHSPKYDKNLFLMMWRTKNRYNNILRRKETVDPKLTAGVPHWPLMEKIGDNWMSRVAWGVLYSLFYIKFAPHWAFFLLLPIHYFMGPVHGAIINWFAHKYGYRNYKVTDTSKNFFPWDIVMMGEGLHNNHHANGGRPNFAVKWWEFDPSYPMIWIFNKLNIIKFTNKGDTVIF